MPRQYDYIIKKDDNIIYHSKNMKDLKEKLSEIYKIHEDFSISIDMKKSSV